MPSAIRRHSKATWISCLKNYEQAKAVGEETNLHSRRERIRKAELAAKEGVSLSEATVKTLIEIGKTDGVPFELDPIKIEEE